MTGAADAGAAMKPETETMSQKPVFAGIVVFGPDADHLSLLADILLGQCQRVAIFVNAIIEGPLVDVLKAKGVEVIHSDINLGVGEALNILCLEARLEGFSRIALFDQDSLPGMTMISELGAAMDLLDAKGLKPAVVGPKITAPTGQDNHYRSPRQFVRAGRRAIGELVPLEFVITSGSLVDLNILMQAGLFSSDFFIDAIDTEWCFRAWHRGFSCWVHNGSPMPHSVGSGVIRLGWLGRSFPAQGLFRYGATIRNQTVCLGLRTVPFLWKLRIAALIVVLGIVVVASHRPHLKTLMFLLRSMWAGMTRRLGPPPGARATVQDFVCK